MYKAATVRRGLQQALAHPEPSLLRDLYPGQDKTVEHAMEPRASSKRGGGFLEEVQTKPSLTGGERRHL